MPLAAPGRHGGDRAKRFRRARVTGSCRSRPPPDLSSAARTVDAKVVEWRRDFHQHLLGVAQVLSGLKSQLRRQVLFVFQPAEQGAPDGEKGGAGRIAEGALDAAKPAAMFGLHVVCSLRRA